MLHEVVGAHRLHPHTARGGKLANLFATGFGPQRVLLEARRLEDPLDGVQPEPGRFGHLALEGGSFSTATGELDGNLATADGGVAFRLNATYHRTDGYREGKDGELMAVNPALTAMANALRVGDHLLDRLGVAAGRASTTESAEGQMR